VSHTKRYDQEYFDRWYRSARARVSSRAGFERKVALAVAAAEQLLGRPLRSVLDVGCGEARWQPALQRLRPGSRYAGVDASEYAVRRFGARRNIRLGTVGALGELGLAGPFDLVVCADVLHYVAAGELARGVEAMAGLLGGVAFLETYTAADEIAGDMAGFRRRSPAWYRTAFARAGLVPCGLHFWVGRERGRSLSALERPLR
jgi:SAM-dependent methyltransferase